VFGASIHGALIDGFGWVMMYGGIGVWILAGISFAIFGHRKLQTHELSRLPP
jgi:hypothetical protein